MLCTVCHAFTGSFEGTWICITGYIPVSYTHLNTAILVHLPQAISLIFGGSGIVPAAVFAIILNIVLKILDIINMDTHKEIIAKLDYEAPSCTDCGYQMKKYDFQKPSKIPYLETTGMPTRILLKKASFQVLSLFENGGG